MQNRMYWKSALGIRDITSDKIKFGDMDSDVKDNIKRCSADIEKGHWQDTGIINRVKII